jgi:DNA-binding LacI/PurR family transcriptional regulator
MMREHRIFLTGITSPNLRHSGRHRVQVLTSSGFAAPAWAAKDRRTGMKPGKDGRSKEERPVTLKAVAQHLRLSPGTVSAVVNDSPAAKHIPQRTRARIMAAVRELNYQPNFFARSLRKKRTYTVGILANEIGDAYGSLVISGVENSLRQRQYFFLTGIHRHDPQLLFSYSQLLLQRGVEGFITIDLNLPHSLPLPTVAVAGHRDLPGVSNVILDHRKAAWMALKHLLDLGHKQIAFMKGLPASADSVDRWQAIREVAKELDIQIDPDLTVQIESSESSPLLGYPYGKQLLARRKNFTALFAYNDISAIGAIRAFKEAGIRVPEDISVVGFDDIESAAFNSPTLTTVRQPLREMGEAAAQMLLKKIEGEEDVPQAIAVQPELIERQSSAHINGKA